MSNLHEPARLVPHYIPRLLLLNSQDRLYLTVFLIWGEAVLIRNKR